MFDAIIETKLMEGTLIFVNKKTNKVFLMMETTPMYVEEDPAIGEAECLERLRYYGIEKDVDALEVIYDEGDLEVRFIMA